MPIGVSSLFKGLNNILPSTAITAGAAKGLRSNFNLPSTAIRSGVGSIMGAGAGLMGAALSGGNYGQGMLMGGFMGGIGGYGYNQKNLAMMNRSMRSAGINRQGRVLGRNITGPMGMMAVAGIGGGMMLSGTRNPKNRGFNGARGSRVSSVGY